MNRRALQVGWYRFRATFGQRWGGYLSVVLLVGVMGGIAMAAVAGARQTQSSFPAFLESTNPSAMDIDVGPYNARLINKIARLPQVASLKSYVSLNVAPLTATGKPDLSNPFGNLEIVGSINGLYFSQDRVTIVAGRQANPNDADEIVVNRYSAQLFGLHVGQAISVGAYSNAELNASGYPTGPPVLRITLHIVGIAVFNDEVIQDEVDRIPRALLTPALTDRLSACCASYAWSGLTLKHGAADVAAVEREYLALLPPADPYYFHVTSIVEAAGEEAVKPEAIALGVFGVIAGLAALFVGGQAISRQIRVASPDGDVLRSLGADPRTTSVDVVLGVVIALSLATLLAAGVALTASPFALVGPIRSVVGSPGFSVDWTVLTLGSVALFATLAGVAVLFAYRDAPHREARIKWIAVARESAIVRAASSSGLPIAASAGVRFALESGRGRTAIPARSAISGALLAVVFTVAALVFGSSLTTLVNSPPLYGWNWNYALEADAGYGDIPGGHLDHLLNQDHSIAASSDVYFETFAFDGQAIPVIGTTPRAAVQPPLLSGHGLDGPNQVVVGPATLAQLHKRLGDTVVARYTSHVTTLRIVGTATMPTIGIGHGLHLSLGVGAVVDYQLIPSAARNIQAVGAAGPNMVLIRFKSGANPTVAVHSLTRMASALSGDVLSVLVVPAQRPAQIVNYRSMGTTPAVLAAALALGAFSALGLTLTASVQRRRRDLALFKTLGFTRRQLAASVAWQATITVGVGTIVGLPLGIVAGRGLWDLFAHELDAVARPTVPALSLLLVAVSALLLANVVALFPARIAARTRAAAGIRAERE